jgi:hypothetical protein
MTVLRLELSALIVQNAGSALSDTCKGCDPLGDTTNL